MLSFISFLSLGAVKTIPGVSVLQEASQIQCIILLTTDLLQQKKKKKAKSVKGEAHG
jgi:hypothetical protein